MTAYLGRESSRHLGSLRERSVVQRFRRCSLGWSRDGFSGTSATGVPATRYAIDGERAVIGRNSDCDVPLDVAAVSRRHAAIIREQDGFFVEDLR